MNHLKNDLHNEVSDTYHEIKQACENLGLTGFIRYEPFAFRRVRVFVNDKVVGIYDMDKHTFVD